MPREKSPPSKTIGVRIPASVLPVLNERAARVMLPPTSYVRQLVVAALSAPERPLPAGTPKPLAEPDGCASGKHPPGRRIGKGCGACGNETAWSKS